MNPHEYVRQVHGDGLGAQARRQQLAGGVGGPRFPTCARHPSAILPPAREHQEQWFGRIVYVCRNPKDAFVSDWFFVKKVSSAYGADARSITLKEAFELFC
ncbi:hypothetical protein BAE44_0005992 [Dichanthelium oligosanthes]|uniref:Sulfotransferase n=1 Tax=Dichanthelium oligosanthes TaxID=888268 RepID=A0A1E5W6C7_9POAL|nr:hypothetical protein BAE44_0005992 [Dichanthelium oligosanthes]